MYKMAFEAIKIVELMSQLNIEEFQMNQWMLRDALNILTLIESESWKPGLVLYSHDLVELLSTPFHLPA